MDQLPRDVLACIGVALSDGEGDLSKFISLSKRFSTLHRDVLVGVDPAAALVESIEAGDERWMRELLRGPRCDAAALELALLAACVHRRHDAAAVLLGEKGVAADCMDGLALSAVSDATDEEGLRIHELLLLGHLASSSSLQNEESQRTRSAHDVRTWKQERMTKAVNDDDVPLVKLLLKLWKYADAHLFGMEAAAKAEHLRLLRFLILHPPEEEDAQAGGTPYRWPFICTDAAAQSRFDTVRVFLERTRVFEDIPWCGRVVLAKVAQADGIELARLILDRHPGTNRDCAVNLATSDRMMTFLTSGLALSRHGIVSQGHAFANAAFNGRDSILRILLSPDVSATLRIPSRSKGIALVRASIGGHAGTVSYLLNDVGVGVESVSRIAYSLEHASTPEIKAELARFLPPGSSWSGEPLRRRNHLEACVVGASMQGFSKRVRELVVELKRLDWHASQSQMQLALKAATLGGHRRTAEALLAAGVVVDKESLHYAIFKKRTGLVKLFVSQPTKPAALNSPAFVGSNVRRHCADHMLDLILSRVTPRSIRRVIAGWNAYDDAWVLERLHARLAAYKEMHGDVIDQRYSRTAHACTYT